MMAMEVVICFFRGWLAAASVDGWTDGMQWNNVPEEFCATAGAVSRWRMPDKEPTKESAAARRETSLSRDSIIDAAIALLDSGGEDGLTFRALAQRLATGAGAIYWHVANKSDLLTAACDSIVARTLEESSAPSAQLSAPDIIRGVALALFDMIDVHPWVGMALNRAPGRLPMVRILERLGQQVCAIGVLEPACWATVSALLNYILGVSGQNAANAQIGRQSGVAREDFLGALAATWRQLDADAYPFTHAIAGQLSAHDDRADFLAGIDLILAGIASGATTQR